MKDKSINYQILVFPLCIILLLALLILFFPKRAQVFIGFLNDIFVDKFGAFYILLGVGVLFACVYAACSRFGSIRLSGGDAPKYGPFRWGSMIFISTMAADILYWSLIEWVYYYQANPFGAADLSAADRQLTASMYPLFHWGAHSLGVLYFAIRGLRVYVFCKKNGKLYRRPVVPF